MECNSLAGEEHKQQIIALIANLDKGYVVRNPDPQIACKQEEHRERGCTC